MSKLIASFDPSRRAVVDDCDACDGCDSAHVDDDRRRFFADAARLAVGALVMLGARRAQAAELPVMITRALEGSRAEVKRYAIPAADGVAIDRDTEVILVRWQNAVYAFALSCPHQNTALRWVESDARFQCPKHKSKYRPDGSFIEGRATRAMDRFSITRQGSEVVVDLDALHQQDKDPSGWTAAVVPLT